MVLKRQIIYCKALKVNINKETKCPGKDCQTCPDIRSTDLNADKQAEASLNGLLIPPTVKIRKARDIANAYLNNPEQLPYLLSGGGAEINQASP